MMHSSVLDTALKSARRRKNRKRTTKKETISHSEAGQSPSETASTSPTVYGPYADGGRWRIIAVDGEIRRALKADTLAEAERIRDELLVEFQRHEARTFDDALKEYEANLIARGVQSAQQNVAMLRRFLPLDDSILTLTAQRAESMYATETQRTKDDGQTIATATHHLVLQRAKHFYAWALSKRYAKLNPFAEIRALGRCKRGKPQLRIDEARKLVAVAMEHAAALKVGATATLMQIFLGLRPTEAMVRVVRDLDDDGRVLWVPFGKTQNAKRRLQVPEALRQILVKHAAGKGATDPLLGPAGEPMHKRFTIRHQLPRLCAEAGVPQVCPHSLRGLNATLALEAGAAPQSVAAALGHASFNMTAKHYADSDTVANLSMRKVAAVLDSPKERIDLNALAALLRQSLSHDELETLRSKLANSL